MCVFLGLSTEIWEILPHLARVKDLAYQRLVSLLVHLLIISPTMLNALQTNKAIDPKATPNLKTLVGYQLLLVAVLE